MDKLVLSQRIGERKMMTRISLLSLGYFVWMLKFNLGMKEMCFMLVNTSSYFRGKELSLWYSFSECSRGYINSLGVHRYGSIMAHHFADRPHSPKRHFDLLGVFYHCRNNRHRCV